MNTEKKIINKVKTLLGMEVKLEQMKLENGAVLEAEVFEVGAEIFVVADEERVAVPVGEYIVEDGSTIVVAEEGIIGEIKEAGAAEEEEEAATDEVVEEEELEAESTSPKKIVKSISEERFFSEIEKLRNEINDLKLSKEVIEEKVELSEVEGISHNPENVADKKEVHLFSQNAKTSVQDRIYNIINNK